MPSEFYASFQRELEAGLDELAACSQRRNLVEVQGVNLCSNDYLGLAANLSLKEAVLRAVHEAPRIGGTGSRLLSGHSAIWDELEEEFAKFAGTGAALYFGSGYAANLGLLTSLLSKNDLVFSDALNHASIIDGIRLSNARKVIYRHLDLDALESDLRAHGNERCRKLIVTETVFSMDGDVAPVKELLLLAERYGAGLILDEAHATAVHGPSGKGIAAQVGVTRDLVAIVHTCGKALASAGAFVCGSRTLKEHLINTARTFIFSTAMPSYMAAQIRAALRLSLEMDAQRNTLHLRSESFRAALQRQGWDTSGSATQIVPAIVGANDVALAAAEYLQQEGFAVRAIRPPTVPVGRARLRFSLTAAVPAKELDRLQKSMDAWCAKGHRPAFAGHA